MNINKIIEKLSTDKEIAEKYAAFSDIDEILAQAKADGFDVSREDVQAVLGKLGGKSGELSEDELAVVACGADDKNTCPICGGPRGGSCYCYECRKCGTLMQAGGGGINSYRCPRCGYRATIQNGGHKEIR